MPEGAEPNRELIDEFAKVADGKLDQAGADKLVSLHLQAQEQAHDRLIDGWEVDTKREFGEQLPVMVDTIRNNLMRNADPAFLYYMNWSGLGSHPAVVRQLYAWAQQIERARR